MWIYNDYILTCQGVIVVKKVVCAITSVLLIMLLLTGCVRVNLGITVKQDGTIDMSMLTAVSDSMKDLIGEYADSIFDNANILGENTEDENYKVYPYAEDGYTGYIISKTDMTEEDLKDTVMTLTKQGSKYILDLNLNSKELLGNQYLSMVKSSGGSIEVTITLPNRAISSNATSVSRDGKTLTWDLTEFKEEKVHVEYRIVSTLLRVVTIVVLVLICLIALALIYFCIMAIKKHKKTETFADKEEAEKLRTYKKLLDEGILTQQEFDAKKAEILNLNKNAEDKPEAKPDEIQPDSAEEEKPETAEEEKTETVSEEIAEEPAEETETDKE